MSAVAAASALLAAGGGGAIAGTLAMAAVPAVKPATASGPGGEGGATTIAGAAFLSAITRAGASATLVRCLADGGAITGAAFSSAVTAAGASATLVRSLASGWLASAGGRAGDGAGILSCGLSSATIIGAACFTGAIRVPCHTATTATAATPAKMPTLAAFAFRHSMGQPYVYPDHELNYAGNFLGMMYKMTELKYEPDPRLERALDVLFILHADHEQNASTSAVRSVGSTQVDPYSAVAAGVAALYGPLHGGANEAALRMLQRIGSVENIPGFLEGVKAGNERLMGFGHRVYKNYDPRARIIRKHLDAVFEVRGKSPLLQVASELEKRALDDDYFTSRKLYPNVDFYSGLIYEALGLPVAMFPVMFAIGRTSGWIAQWLEMVQDSEQKIARPRQIYTGERDRDYVPIEQRG